jgi:hypothetical protein
MSSDDRHLSITTRSSRHRMLSIPTVRCRVATFRLLSVHLCPSDSLTLDRTAINQFICIFDILYKPWW